MRYLSVQIQPERSPNIDMDELSRLFQTLANRADLVRGHSFDNGYDGGSYYNFTFETNRPSELWLLIQQLVFQAPDHEEKMAGAAMAMCSSDQGWDDYVQLYHWDPKVPVFLGSAL